MHVRPVQFSVGPDQIAKRWRSRVCQVGASANGCRDAIIPTVRIDVEFRGTMASSAARSALRSGRRKKQMFPIVFASGEIRKIRSIIPDYGSPGVVLRIERLNASDKLRQ